MDARTFRLIAVLITTLLAILSLVKNAGQISARKRRLQVLLQDPKSVVEKEALQPLWRYDSSSSEVARKNLRLTLPSNLSPGFSNVAYKLPKSADDWCAPPRVPALPYSRCTDSVTINRIPLYGGLTNSLKMLLLGAILSFEEDRCFYVDESTSALPKRRDPANEFQTAFMDRYFEKIGLPSDHPQVKAALQHDRVKTRDWKETWDWNHNRRIKDQIDDIDSLGFHGIEGHRLKRIMMKRMWRPLPHVRHATCSSLEKHVGENDYIAFSIRRGDKGDENFEFATMEQYIDAAEKAAKMHFGGTIPTIFVATDDCTVMEELRIKRPNWNFVSECDYMKKEGGFRLEAMADWTHDEADAHFGKFFVELYALAAAKYFIGVIYTNVTWWVLFMRSKHDPSTFQILVTPGTERREGIELW